MSEFLLHGRSAQGSVRGGPGGISACGEGEAAALVGEIGSEVNGPEEEFIVIRSQAVASNLVVNCGPIKIASKISRVAA